MSVHNIGSTVKALARIGSIFGIGSVICLSAPHALAEMNAIEVEGYSSYQGLRQGLLEVETLTEGVQLTETNIVQGAPCSASRPCQTNAGGHPLVRSTDRLQLRFLQEANRLDSVREQQVTGQEWSFEGCALCYRSPSTPKVEWGDFSPVVKNRGWSPGQYISPEF
jgi:hypothetical protein